MKLNGAAILIECLIEQGVGTVFGFPWRRGFADLR